MAIIRKKQKVATPDTDTVELKLKKEECKMLLQIIANSTFSGKDIQILYDTAVKLQRSMLK